MLIISARINGTKIPSELEEDLKLILKKVPLILKSAVYFGFSRSIPRPMNPQ
jgi:hypothetical protein